MKHGAVPRALWQQPPFKALKSHAKLVMLYALTSPLGNSAHLFRCGPAEIALACGITTKSARAGLEELAAARFLHVDFEVELIWLESQMLSELGSELQAGDNRIKFLSRLARELPDCLIKADFIARYNAPYHLKIEGPCKPPPKGPSKGIEHPFEAKDKVKFNSRSSVGEIPELKEDPNPGARVLTLRPGRDGAP